MIAGHQLANDVCESAPLFIKERACSRRDAFCFLLVEFRGAPFENDLLLVGTAQGEPAEDDARKEDSDEENRDALLHVRKNLESRARNTRRTSGEVDFKPLKAAPVIGGAYRASAGDVSQFLA